MKMQWFFFSLGLLSGCLPQPDSAVTQTKPGLVIQGGVLSTSSAGGSTGIYIEQNEVAEAISIVEGLFSFTLDADRIDALRLQYGLHDPRLSLYFVSESGISEGAVLMDALNLDYRGVLDLGNVQQQALTTLNGRVYADGLPVAEAQVRLGRQEVVTAADGSFSIDVPDGTYLPLLVSKRGYVQTKGTWLPGVQERRLELYTDLKPAGSIEALPVTRTIGNEAIPLAYSANGTAHWIRVAGSAEALAAASSPQAPWLDLHQPLQFTGGSVIYYQFADRDQKILGPIQTYNLTTTEPVIEPVTAQ